MKKIYLIPETMPDDIRALVESLGGRPGDVLVVVPGGDPVASIVRHIPGEWGSVLATITPHLLSTDPARAQQLRPGRRYSPPRVRLLQ